mmetsp:Transcript_2080/g.6333  ORF Transcript_2080/g.6333 Transcript_2080/m.6333 type:complete len:446 (-) Transcript_2080:30-1367(-)
MDSSDACSPPTVEDVHTLQELSLEPASPLSPKSPAPKRTRFTSALSALAHLATTARRPSKPAAAPAPLGRDELRRIWRPVAIFRLAASRTARDDDAAVGHAAFKMWGELAEAPLAEGARRSPCARHLAVRLARVVARVTVRPHDDARGMARRCRGLVEGAAGWAATEVDAVVTLAEALTERSATIDALDDVAALVEEAFALPPLAPTQTWRPPPAGCFACGPVAIPSRSAYESAAAFHAAHLDAVRRASGETPLLSGYATLAYARETFRGDLSALYAERLASAARRPDAGDLGPGWTFDAASASAEDLPAAIASRLRSPRALAVACLRHTRPPRFEDHAREVAAVVVASQKAGAPRAAWLWPVDLHLSDTVALRCQAMAARDPASDALSLAVVATVEVFATSQAPQQHPLQHGRVVDAPEPPTRATTPVASGAEGFFPDDSVPGP